MMSQKEKEVQIPIYDTVLEGQLCLPESARGLIVFVHGSGSSRHSHRNKTVASFLQEAGFATLLFDLLTEEEDKDSDMRFDIELLTDRLIKTTDWLKSDSDTGDFAIGYFGASTGAAAALNAAAKLGENISAVVSRGGRVDMADLLLPEVIAPTLLIVGSLDSDIMEINDIAYTRLSGTTREIRKIDGASHLFEEPGKLEEVATLAKDWFNTYVFTQEG